MNRLLAYLRRRRDVHAARSNDIPDGLVTRLVPKVMDEVRQTREEGR